MISDLLGKILTPFLIAATCLALGYAVYEHYSWSADYIAQGKLLTTAQSEVANRNTEIAQCTANTVVLNQTIKDQNTAIAGLQTDANNRNVSANAAVTVIAATPVRTTFPKTAKELNLCFANPSSCPAS